MVILKFRLPQKQLISEYPSYIIHSPLFYKGPMSWITLKGNIWEYRFSIELLDISRQDLNSLTLKLNLVASRGYQFSVNISSLNQTHQAPWRSSSILVPLSIAEKFQLSLQNMWRGVTVIGKPNLSFLRLEGREEKNVVREVISNIVLYNIPIPLAPSYS